MKSILDYKRGNIIIEENVKKVHLQGGIQDYKLSHNSIQDICISVFAVAFCRPEFILELEEGNFLKPRNKRTNGVFLSCLNKNYL